MKHTDFFEQARKIKEQERLELLDAIMAHGGEFNWGDDAEKPTIAASLDGIYHSPIDVEVERVVADNKTLKIYGSEKKYGDEVEFGPEEVFTGHLSYIIDYIPETEGIFDVTRKQEFFKITSVCRDDLNGIGFDTSKVDDSTMKRLASKLANDYCEQMFWTSLEIIAEDCLEIPRIWDNWLDKVDFATMEKISGLKQTDFSPEEGYQDFVDAFENWRDDLSISKKQEIYNELHF